MNTEIEDKDRTRERGLLAKEIVANTLNNKHSMGTPVGRDRNNHRALELPHANESREGLI